MQIGSLVGEAFGLGVVALDSIARETGLVARESRRFSASGFLAALMKAAATGRCSLASLAGFLAEMEDASMSRQAVAGRLGPGATAFLMRVVAQLLRTGPGDPVAPTRFGRILLEDSTVIPMHKSNAELFPNNGNGTVETAGCKVNLAHDALSGEVVLCSLEPAREPDQSLAYDILPHLREGDLLVRDMGYFSNGALRAIDGANAFWLSRLPATTSATDRRGRDLVDILQSTVGSRVTIDAVLCRKGREVRCRLVAQRLPTDVAAANRRHRRREARRRRGGQSTPDDGALLRDGWSILVTNAPAAMLPARQARAIYSLRWGAEIGFRAYKGAGHITRAMGRRRSAFHVEAVILASIILHLLAMRSHAALQGTAPRGAPGVSIERTCALFAAHILTLTRDTITQPFEPDPRHVSHDRRRRVTLRESINPYLG